MLRKNIYTWHRRLSLIIALPLVLSAGSGFLHPIMTNIRPAVATQGLNPRVIDSSQLRMPLETAMKANRIATVSNIRIVHIDTNWFYQLQRDHAGIPVYISTRTGKLLANGDYLYAQYLARQFLEGQPRKAAPSLSSSTASSSSSEPSLSTASSSSSASPPSSVLFPSSSSSAPLSDCCNDATSCVLNAPGSKVINTTRLDAFGEEYAEVNRLLPVYKVAFHRPDGIRIYVETTQDRFALAVDNRRAAFNRIFQYIHTYQWLDLLGKGKQIVEFLLIGLAFVTTLMGVFIFFMTKGKKASANPSVRARRMHRYTAITISLFTAMFTFSGAWHALTKLHEDTRRNYFADNRFQADSIHFDYNAIRTAAGRPLTGISLVAIKGVSYWQGTLGSYRIKNDPGTEKHKENGKEGEKEKGKKNGNGYFNGNGKGIGIGNGAGTGNGAGDGEGNGNSNGNGNGMGKDLMRDKEIRSPERIYLRSSDLSVLPEGEEVYARWLATQFSGHPDSAITSESIVTKFDRDYNFTDKRLPVWKINYPVNHNERYYVETSTGCLSVRVDDRDLPESYSFAFFHKHEFLGAFGKSVKDTSTMFWAAAQLVVVAFGLVLYFRTRKRRRLGRTLST